MKLFLSNTRKVQPINLGITTKTLPFTFIRRNYKVKCDNMDIISLE